MENATLESLTNSVPADILFHKNFFWPGWPNLCPQSRSTSKSGLNRFFIQPLTSHVKYS